MSWFGNSSSATANKWKVASYEYAAEVQSSPTLFTAIMTLVWAIAAVLSQTESVGTVAGPAVTALLFIAHNIHARKANREISEALREVKSARDHIASTRIDLDENTTETINAAQAARDAAASAARVEELTSALDKKLDALHERLK